MQKLTSRTLAFLAGCLFVSLLAFRDDKSVTTPPKDNAATTSMQPEIPERMDFAGEPVPLERWDVRERLDRELLFNFYNKPHILYIIKLSNRYFPLIEERLKANGVPDDFKYLCVAESALIDNAISKAGAVGFWQFMPATAPSYNLSVNQQVDHRYDLRRSTDAACVYFKQAYAKFGSWTAAAASYNCGMGGYNGNATFQQTKHYYDLQLPEETSRYMFRILTFKHLLSNAEALGFNLSKEDLYEPLPSREVTVTKSVPDLAAFAISEGTTYKTLRLMNPWIRGRSLPVAAGSTVTLKLPVK
jgi:membrane-bound lytic murein transglycosylase D